MKMKVLLVKSFWCTISVVFSAKYKMMMLIGFLELYVYSKQSSNIQKLHSVAFFSLFLELESMPMQLS